MRHQRERHGNGDQAHLCYKCNHSFTRLENLKRHERTCKDKVLDEKLQTRYNCSKCDREFNHASQLKRHMKTCVEKMCRHCGKRVDDLKSHRERCEKL